MVDTRRSERRAPEAWEFESPSGHFDEMRISEPLCGHESLTSTATLQVRQVPNWLS